MTLQPAQQIPGVYHRRIGDIVVTAISDGYLDGSMDVMRNVDLEKAHQLLRDAFRPARRTNVNAFLIHSSGRLAIVDTGSGNYLLPTAGFVQHNLAAAGIDDRGAAFRVDHEGVDAGSPRRPEGVGQDLPRAVEIDVAHHIEGAVEIAVADR